MTRSNHLLCWCLCAFAALLPTRTRAGDNGSSLGPLYDHFSLTRFAGERTEALGPFFYTESKVDAEHTFAVPPLFSYTFDPVPEDSELNMLYPLITCRRYGSVYRWQLLEVLNRAGGEDPEGLTNRRVTLYPIYFQQRSANSNDNYTALVPIYGHLHDRLYHDRIFFVMFPLYCQTRKKDVVINNYLYPFFDVRHGNRLSGWQFWPVVGHEHKEVTTVTNGFGEPELVPGHDKFFAAWPFYERAITDTGTTNEVRELDVLPFYSRTRSPSRDSTSYLWPFFNIIDDRDDKYHEVQAPWPFIVFAHGEGKTVRRVLPLFSRGHSATLENQSYLWPLIKYDVNHNDPLYRERFRILFFLYSDMNETNTDWGGSRRRTDLLPLFTYHREYNGTTRLQILAPLEPFLPSNVNVEREWSPIWSLWRSEGNPRTGASSQSLLWNLWRRDVTRDARKCSLLFGIFQYQSTVDATRLRLFYIPVVDAKKSPSPVATGPDQGKNR